MGCFNKNQSVPAVFYNATVQRIHFHTPSDHLVFGKASSCPVTLSGCCLVHLASAGGFRSLFCQLTSTPCKISSQTELLAFEQDNTMHGAGLQYPMEAQVIMTISQDDLSSCPSNGCQIGLSVLYTLFDEAEKINRFIDSIVPYIPYSGAVSTPFLMTLQAFLYQ